MKTHFFSRLASLCPRFTVMATVGVACSLLLGVTQARAQLTAAAGATALTSGTGPLTITTPLAITKPGTYYLTQNIVVSGATCNGINVTANNVTVDLNGFTISTTASSTYSASVDNSGIYAPNVSNLTVRNGSINGFFYGVFIAASANSQGAIDDSISYGHLVEDLRLNHNTVVGVLLQGGDSVVRRCQVISTGGTTIQGQPSSYGMLFFGPNNRALDSDVSDVFGNAAGGAGYGIFFAQYATNSFARHNRVSNAFAGIEFGSGATGKYAQNLVGVYVSLYFSGGTDAGGNIVDTNGNGIDDAWEMLYFGNLNYTNPNVASPAGDGYTILQEYQLGRSPTDYYQGVAPGVQISSGNNQRGVAGTMLPQPLVTLITSTSNNAALSNAPVTYQVTGGVAQIATSSAGPWGTSCSVRTTAAGKATVYCRMTLTTSTSIASTIQVTAGSAAALTFNEYVLPPVAAGLNHTLAVDASGTVWSWGYNYYGQLGNGSLGNLSFAGQVTGLPGGQQALAVAAGDRHSLALMSNGVTSQNTVWSWGDNSYGQLGNNTTTQSPVPVEVMMAGANGGAPVALTGVVAVAAGSYHSLAVRSDGTVWAWGRNVAGELGMSTSTSQSALAVQVPGLSGMTAVTAGLYFSVALRGDGTAWAWGYNVYGELGSGSNTNSTSVPTQVSNAAATVAIAAGADGEHLLLLQSNGTVLATGNNQYGQLGNNTTATAYYPVAVMGVGGQSTQLSGVVAIAAGTNHSLAVLGNGNAVAWGSNTNLPYTNTPAGQLGDGAATSTSTSVPVTVAAAVGGTGSLAGASTVSAGGNHSVVVGSGGVLYGFGSDSYGESGNGTEAVGQATPAAVVGLDVAAQPARPTLTPMGGAYSAAQTVTVACATPGATLYYTLDDTAPTTSSASVAAGGTISVGATAILRVRAFASGMQPSPETSALYQIAPGRTAAGLNHTLAVDASGTVWSWGYNYYGQLGNGSLGNLSFAGQVTGLPGGQQALAVAAGDRHSLALMSNGVTSQNTVWSWGDNSYGQLGNNTTTQSPVPVEVMMAGANGGAPVALTGVVAVAAGSYHSLAVRSDGTVWAWGRNVAGELGMSTSTSQSALAVQVPGLSGMTAVTAGLYFSVALRGDGTAWAWGYNVYGELGSGSNTNSTSVPTQVSNAAATVAIAAGADGEHLLLLQSNGTVLATGNNQYGQLGNNTTATAYYPVAVMGVGGQSTQLSGVVAIAAGTNHSLAVLGNGNAVAWGSNTNLPYTNTPAGQLGDGAATSTSTSVPVTVAAAVGGTGSLAGASTVSAGGNHSVVVGSGGVLYGFGSDSYGESGNGTEAVGQATPAAVVGLDVAAQPARPTLTPMGGAYSAAQTVTVACATPGATLYYTLDDTAPTTSSASVAAGGTISVGATAILRVRAFASGMQPSPETSALYQIAPGRTAAGLNHTLAVDASGTVWSWGYNYYGQLGNGSLGNLSFAGQVTGLPGGQQALAVAAGDRHSLALMSNGVTSQNTVWSWGDNSYGQLGNNTTTQSPVPVEVMMAGANGGAPVALTGVVAVAAGSYHSLAVRSDGTVWAWGRNVAGELGMSTSTSQSALAVQVPGLSGMTAVTAGLYFSVALRGDGTAWAWGYNVYGELGSGSNTNSTSVPTQVSNAAATVAIAAGADGEHLLLLQSNGTVLATGNNQYGQLGNNTTATAYYPVAVMGVGGQSTQLSGVVAIAAGTNHSLAVLGNGNAVAWGSNTNLPYTNTPAGQLGDNSTANSSVPVAVATTSSSGSNSLKVVSAGGNHSLAIIGYEGVPIFLGWGDNTYDESDGGYPPLAGGSTPPYYTAPVIVQLPTDSDGDGLPDWQEYLIGTNPLNPDTNGDGISDYVEYYAGFNPAVPGGNPLSLSAAKNAGVNGLDYYSLTGGQPPASTSGAPFITLSSPAGATLQ